MQRWISWEMGALERCLAGLDWLDRLNWLNRLNWLDRLGWLAARRSRDAAFRPQHLVTGERGEEAAFFFLRRNGFTVVARRWNDGPLPGDLDLIAWHEDVLCFVEVKTRGSKEGPSASSAVDREKRKTLRRLAAQYLRQLQEEARPETRFDIVVVYEVPGQPTEIRLIPGAFGWTESH